MGVGELSVTISFKNVKDQFASAFVGIYGQNVDGDRRFLGMNCLIC